MAGKEFKEVAGLFENRPVRGAKAAVSKTQIKQMLINALPVTGVDFLSLGNRLGQVMGAKPGDQLARLFANGVAFQIDAEKFGFPVYDGQPPAKVSNQQID